MLSTRIRFLSVRPRPVLRFTSRKARSLPRYSRKRTLLRKDRRCGGPGSAAGPPCRSRDCGSPFPACHPPPASRYSGRMVSSSAGSCSAAEHVLGVHAVLQLHAVHLGKRDGVEAFEYGVRGAHVGCGPKGAQIYRVQAGQTVQGIAASPGTGVFFAPTRASDGGQPHMSSRDHRLEYLHHADVVDLPRPIGSW